MSHMDKSFYVCHLFVNKNACGDNWNNLLKPGRLSAQSIKFFNHKYKWFIEYNLYTSVL